MQNLLLNKILRFSLTFSLLACLQACAPAATDGNGLDALQAYETSGAISVQPYTRSIFSNSNF